MADPPGRPESSPDGSKPVPPAEWAVAALGVLLVAAVLGFLLREAAAGPRRPPDVAVRVDTVARGGAAWLVTFRARNAGDEAASDVTVRGTLATPAGDTLVREARVEHLPGGSERGGGLFFSQDPRAGTLRLEAVGYEAP